MPSELRCTTCCLRTGSYSAPAWLLTPEFPRIVSAPGLRGAPPVLCHFPYIRLQACKTFQPSLGSSMCAGSMRKLLTRNSCTRVDFSAVVPAPTSSLQGSLALLIAKAEVGSQFSQSLRVLSQRLFGYRLKVSRRLIKRGRDRIRDFLQQLSRLLFGKALICNQRGEQLSAKSQLSSPGRGQRRNLPVLRDACLDQPYRCLRLECIGIKRS